MTHLMRPLDLSATHFRIAQLQTECIQHAIGRNAGGHCSGRRLMMMHRLVRHAVAAPRTTANRQNRNRQDKQEEVEAEQMLLSALRSLFLYLL